MSKTSYDDNTWKLNREWQRAREQIQEALDSLNGACVAINVDSAEAESTYLSSYFSGINESDCDYLMVHRDDNTIVFSIDNGVTWVQVFNVSAPVTLESGMVIEYAGTIAQIPSGYLVCDGQAVSRATYASLFAVIGTDFGIGDGSTTFNVPDLRARSVMSVNDGVGNSLTVRAINDSVGAETHTLSQAEGAAHSHGKSGSGNLSSGNSGASAYQNAGGNTGSSGGGGSHQNMSPFFVLHYLIKT